MAKPPKSSPQIEDAKRTAIHNDIEMLKVQLHALREAVRQNADNADARKVVITLILTLLEGYGRMGALAEDRSLPFVINSRAQQQQDDIRFAFRDLPESILTPADSTRYLEDADKSYPSSAEVFLHYEATVIPPKTTLVAGTKHPLGKAYVSVPTVRKG